MYYYRIDTDFECIKDTVIISTLNDDNTESFPSMANRCTYVSIYIGWSGHRSNIGFDHATSRRVMAAVHFPWASRLHCYLFNQTYSVPSPQGGAPLL